MSYPEYVNLRDYKEYLKQDASEYQINDVLNQFSIYSATFDGGESWIEYYDEQ